MAFASQGSLLLLLWTNTFKLLHVTHSAICQNMKMKTSDETTGPGNANVPKVQTLLRRCSRAAVCLQWSLLEDCGNKWVNKPRCPWIITTWFVKAGSDSSVVTAKVGQQPLWGWCNKQETGQRHLRTSIGVLRLNSITWSMQIHACNQIGLTMSFAASCDHGGPSSRPTWGSQQNQLLDGKKNAVPTPSELPCCLLPT